MRALRKTHDLQHLLVITGEMRFINGSFEM